MKVNLAGFNVDKAVLDELFNGKEGRADVTPEVISASYARISRDPRPIDELRDDARKEVERARKSNKTIIFQMGHHSIAEHAVFNFDLLDVSRYAIERIEKFRLCSFTEKSQRYITLEDDCAVPAEINDSPYKDEFISVVKQQNSAYSKFYEKLKKHVFSKFADLAKDPKKSNMLDGWAKEDARYITSLATKGQLGLTINARNLELLFRRFACSPLDEVKRLGAEIYRLVERVAPSVILFVEANKFDAETYSDISEFIKSGSADSPEFSRDEVSLVDYTKDGDLMVLAGLVHSVSGMPFRQCAEKVRSYSNDDRLELIKKTFKHMRFYDSTLREFEYAGLTFELIVSASCFAQLKRHRMATITCQDYDPGLGVTVPDSVKEIGEEKSFMDIINISEELYEKMYRTVPAAAPYILANAHRRRLLIKTNARELYHISRLREDEHAQWDIKKITGQMNSAAKKVMPLVFLMLCGKNKFNEVFNQVFGES